MRFVRIFVGFAAAGATNRSGATKISNFSHYAASFLRYLEICVAVCSGFLQTKTDDLESI